jgi:hypothetical protein
MLSPRFKYIKAGTFPLSPDNYSNPEPNWTNLAEKTLKVKQEKKRMVPTGNSSIQGNKQEEENKRFRPCHIETDRAGM